MGEKISRLKFHGPDKASSRRFDGGRRIKSHGMLYFKKRDFTFSCEVMKLLGDLYIHKF